MVAHVHPERGPNVFSVFQAVVELPIVVGIFEVLPLSAGQFVARLIEGDYLPLDDSSPWLEPGVNTAMDPQLFRLTVTDHCTWSIPADVTHGHVHLCESDTFLGPRLYWVNGDVYFCRELTAEEAETLSALLLIEDGAIT